MDCPKILNTIIFADDARLAAQLSCLFARRGSYLPVCDGPRIQSPDKDAEVVRRHNAVARSKSKDVYLAGMSEESRRLLHKSLSRHKNISCHVIASTEEIALKLPESDKPPLVWGNNRIGIGLLQALRAKRSIAFEDVVSPSHSISSLNRHLVVCEEGEELSQVIAANYAHAIGAGLHLIPSITRERADDILEAFYKLSDGGSGVPPADAQQRLREELLEICASLPVPKNGSITFIGGLPYGFAYPEYPTTHLFDYPDLGCAIVNGFSAEQDGTPGTGVVTLVDPGTTTAPEIEAAVQLLKRLAGDMTFAGARAYVGTLFEVLPFEAEAVLLRIMDKHWGKYLPVAVWAAQRDVYRGDARRPYVVSGVFPQRLRVRTMNYPRRVYRRLARGLAFWTARENSLSATTDANKRKAVAEIVAVYRRETRHFADYIKDD